MEMLDAMIANLEARLGLAPGDTREEIGRADRHGHAGDLTTPTVAAWKDARPGVAAAPRPKKVPPAATVQKGATVSTDDSSLPDICKVEFKVGQITKVWNHENADKLYCEEIDCGEAEPRQIASGLRPHFTLEQMQGQRLLVVANLKAKNLVGFKSHGMVLCAATTRPDGSECVEFVEPPPDAPLGEVVTFDGLPPPQPWSGAQMDKKKVFATVAEGLRTADDDGTATWNGHAFLTSAGPCRAHTIRGGVMR